MSVSAADAVITAVLKSLLIQRNVKYAMEAEFVLIAMEAEESIKSHITSSQNQCPVKFGFKSNNMR